MATRRIVHVGYHIHLTVEFREKLLGYVNKKLDTNKPIDIILQQPYVAMYHAKKYENQNTMQQTMSQWYTNNMDKIHTFYINHIYIHSYKNKSIAIILQGTINGNHIYVNATSIDKPIMTKIDCNKGLYGDPIVVTKEHELYGAFEAHVAKPIYQFVYR